MKNLKRLGVSVTLICVLAMTALAGETNSLPCAPDPGITNTPPCAVAQTMPGDSAAQEETNDPPASNPVGAFSVTEVALVLLQSVLSIF